VTRFWPFRHLGLKVWSVVLAVMLWFIVAGEETVERGLRVPLELQQFPAGLELQDDAPSLVDVRVRGASGALSRLGPGDIVAVLDLRAARAGRRLYQVTPEQVRVPFGVQVTQVTPPGIALVFEASAVKQVPIVPAIEGNPAPGFVVGKVTVEPRTVDVVGPESAVQRVTEALTESVEVMGAEKDVISSVSVGFADVSVRPRAPRPALVTVQIIPGPVERELDAQPVHLENLSSGLSAQVVPPAITLVLRGTRVGVSRVASADVRASVDAGGLGVGEYALPVRATTTSQDAGVARVNPATVQVRIVRTKN
jgi:YbbR domain-containing protein